MELVSPAGSAEKLAYAWEYGADAAYVGLSRFSLRAKAENLGADDWQEVARLKAAYAARGTPKRLFCAVNAVFHNDDVRDLISSLDEMARYPFDAFILQDIGIAPILRERFPGAALHLSTQANCVNAWSARAWRDLGFRRVVLGREASLAEIREIKDACPDLEIECFAHGAMCIAYSGRCLMSAYLAGRSANAGSCSHPCRWEWKALARSEDLLLEERERPGEYFPVVEGDDYTALFSSRDLCMIDHVAEMRDAGVDSLKIEGRMKSIYYVALVTQAYRKRIDESAGLIAAADAEPFAREVLNVPHRAYGTGFYFSREDANQATRGGTDGPYLLAGTVGPRSGERTWAFNAMNKIVAGEPIEFVGPGIASITAGDYDFIDPETGERLEWVSHGHPALIRVDAPIEERFLARVRKPAR